jgi:hypothetical protein
MRAKEVVRTRRARKGKASEVRGSTGQAEIYDTVKREENEKRARKSKTCCLSLLDVYDPVIRVRVRVAAFIVNVFVMMTCVFEVEVNDDPFRACWFDGG